MQRPFVVFLFAALGAFASLPIPAADPPPGARPGDETMTCAQIATELAPYAQQMAAAIAPLAQSSREAVAQGQREVARETPNVIALSAAASASSGTPGASAAVSKVEAAEQQRAWNQALAEQKPLSDTMNAQTAQILPQAQAMQANPRIQRLMQLAQDKHCQ